MMGSLPKQWLDKASEDLEVAHLVFAEGHMAHACFLSQQCMEKALKAYLIARVGKHPYTHKLVDLLVECQSVQPPFSQFLPQCTVVDQFYVPTRYPDAIPGGLPGGLPGKADANEAMSAAEEVLSFVLSHL